MKSFPYKEKSKEMSNKKNNSVVELNEEKSIHFLHGEGRQAGRG